MNKTKIEWCDSTWNPVTGCLHGCEYCYARKIAHRFGGTIQQRDIVAKFHDLHEPMYTENNMGKITIAPYPYDFDPTFHRYRLDEPARKTKPQNIFVCSMADLFGDWVPDEWIEEVFNACKSAPQHRYLFLTKNPVRYEKILDKYFPLNMWFGWSQTGPTEPPLTFSTHHSIQTFISIEPLLKPFECFNVKGLDWVIIGAETGNRKNKVVPQREWIDDIVKECDKVCIPVFMKDSLVPIVGEENMRREFPWEDTK